MTTLVVIWNTDSVGHRKQKKQSHQRWRGCCGMVADDIGFRLVRIERICSVLRDGIQHQAHEINAKAIGSTL